MKIYEILNDDIFNLPKRGGISDNKIFAFPNFVFRILQEYLAKIRNIENVPIRGSYNFFGIDNNLFLSEVVNKLTLSIRNSLIKYLEGMPCDAYSVLKDSFQYNSKNLIGDYISLGQFKFHQEKYYRVYYNSHSLPIEKSLLMHVPFDKVEKITAQRYSIPGFPSLYLGNHVITCVKELNLVSKKRTDLNKILISKFEFKNQIPTRFLDLTIKTDLFRKRYATCDNGKYEALFVYLLSFPLILASSIIVNKPKEPFKPEYIIPQLILQWIRKEVNNLSIEGIIYSSTKANVNGKNLTNLVMPPKGVGPEGHCPYLKDFFEHSMPVTFRSLIKDDFSELDKSNELEICNLVEQKINMKKAQLARDTDR